MRASADVRLDPVPDCCALAPPPLGHVLGESEVAHDGVEAGEGVDACGRVPVGEAVVVACVGRRKRASRARSRRSAEAADASAVTTRDRAKRGDAAGTRTRHERSRRDGRRRRDRRRAESATESSRVG
jgi:hypothetical protein